LGRELQEGRRIRNKQTNVNKNMRKNQINKHTNKIKKLPQMDKKTNKQKHEQNLK
jgi:hypothetical protein